jgi:UDP-glucose 4-epimerase
MKILVTGGAGYIGTELIDLLQQQKEVNEITVYDNLSRGDSNFFHGGKISLSKVKFEQGELLDSRHLKKVLDGVDIVYHLAARVTTPFANTDSHLFEQVNHWGTAELLYAVEAAPVKKFVFISSASVYGSSVNPATEETKPNPTSFYGISKQRAEEHVKRLFDKMPTLILRCGNVYGYSRSMRFDAVINRFLFDAHFNGRIFIHGNGTQYRSFIHVKKVAEALGKMTVTEIPSGIYNLTDRNLSVIDLVEILKEVYPGMEYLFINQHIQMSELKVERSIKLSKFISLPQTNLVDELKECGNYFTIPPLLKHT